jgi:hypothetical protein
MTCEAPARRRELDRHKWLKVVFPLFETLRPVWTRGNCEVYLEKRVPHEVVKSACVFCPFRDDAEWEKIKANPADWKRAVAVDESLRDSKISRQFRDLLYLHKTAQPLVQIDFADKNLSLGFQQECDGVCGT